MTKKVAQNTRPSFPHAQEGLGTRLNQDNSQDDNWDSDMKTEAKVRIRLETRVDWLQQKSTTNYMKELINSIA